MTKQPEARLTGPGEFAPAGELQGVDSTFNADQIATAFEVDVHRVHAALAGEFDMAADGNVDSRQAQLLSEVILGDLPMDKRESALMTLGAFTPRADHAWGAGEADPAEESDSQRDDQPGI
ncbi:MAG: hypothetical protein WKF81_09220 [Thermomicrobiales bacterium]